MFEREQARDELSGEREETFYYHLVVLSDPDDCARIARIHLRKDGAFTPSRCLALKCPPRR